jgi:putative ABC transport system permease protein
VPSVEVLTSAQFARRSTKYWMLETGIGITVSLTALLGVIVCTVVTSQALFSITHDHLGNYATLLAIGFTRLQLLRVVLFQGLILGCGGIGLGSGMFFLAASGTLRTPVPLETTPAVFAMLVGVSLGSCVLGAFLSVRAVLSIDPLSVFRG